MKSLLLFSFFFFFSASSSSSAVKFSYRFPASALVSETRNYESIKIGKVVAYKVKYYMQTLDHFNYQPSGNGKFRQKYLVDDRHWAGPMAPIFVYCGNEADIEWFAQNTGFMFDVAPHFKALLLFIEHRYYGESIPFGGDKDVAFANATNLGYLCTTQALADYATLITDIKKSLSSEQSPVVVIGGSYGGMLAAWFRLKYPHVAIGALASSAPILGFLDLASPYTFSSIVSNNFKSESENCYNVIKNSWKEIEEVVGTKEGVKRLGESFKICHGERWGGDLLAEFIEDWLQYALAYVAMADYPTPSDFLNPLPAYPVKAMCRAVDNPTTGNDTFARMYGVMNVYYNQSGRAGRCFDLTQNLVNPAIGQSQWSWQSCTELILPTGANNNESIFPASTYNFTDDAKTCQLRYGIPPRPHWLETQFGGHDIRRALKRFGSNIIFFNGLRDPWSGGGVLKSVSKSIIAIVAPEGSHHVDLRFATKDDPVWLRKVRRRERQIIRRWLDQYYHDLK